MRQRVLRSSLATPCVSHDLTLFPPLFWCKFARDGSNVAVTGPHAPRLKPEEALWAGGTVVGVQTLLDCPIPKPQDLSIIPGMEVLLDVAVHYYAESGSTSQLMGWMGVPGAGALTIASAPPPAPPIAPPPAGPCPIRPVSAMTNVQIFSADGSWTAPDVSHFGICPTAIAILIVAGGGGGGRAGGGGTLSAPIDAAIRACIHQLAPRLQDSHMQCAVCVHRRRRCHLHHGARHHAWAGLLNHCRRRGRRYDGRR